VGPRTLLRGVAGWHPWGGMETQASSPAPTERPLGLGILAVASFALAYLNIQAAVNLVLLVSRKLMMPLNPVMMVGYYTLPPWQRWFFLVAAVLKIVFLVVSGIGYFLQRRFGRRSGMAYAVVSIVESIVAGVTVGMSGPSVIAVLFALYVLLAVNTMYRANLTR
jgi:hypothetical protein